MSEPVDDKYKQYLAKNDSQHFAHRKIPKEMTMHPLVADTFDHEYFDDEDMSDFESHLSPQIRQKPMP